MTTPEVDKKVYAVLCAACNIPAGRNLGGFPVASNLSLLRILVRQVTTVGLIAEHGLVDPLLFIEKRVCLGDMHTLYQNIMVFDVRYTELL